ncbi:Tetratricopeptide repeat protein 37 [Eumeta japonica]|uniref:Tetratricopeptide repeat protein 37 n=1 Tax=Eumeta variegata TaxID=151549 RepID=A0A4C1WZT6_EUMVA|nr:Tetratricopeptide repeat protein 37 [Eumeta japonica]
MNVDVEPLKAENYQMADVKTLLKEARKLIDDKDYQGAQECCKNILRKDKQNYLALVLLGKSLQDSEQAPLAFPKAIACKPDHILAWQGLANYYEKREDEESKHKLLSIYDEILNLQLENDKVLEVVTKVSEMATSIKTGRIINVILKLVLREMEQPIHDFAENQLIKLVTEDTPLLEEDIPKLITIFESILSTLYLKLEQYKLANYCFWRGQSTLPSYPHSWIGQALIAEVLREEEAMDLFRHASRLGYHRESALGYADWVCRTLKKGYMDDPEMRYVIDGLHAVPYAIDLMEWYSNFEADNIYACTILGILKEKYGLLNSSLGCFERALKCVNQNDQTQKSMALLNVGRVLLRLQRYEEAIELFKSVPEASMDSACGLALSLYRKGLYEEAYAAYDMALHWLCSNDIEKSHLLIAMAGIIYTYKTPDDAKTLLFQSIQVASNKPTPHNLFAICALGLLNTDQSLTKLALSELQKYNKDVNFYYDIGFLKSYSLLHENKTEAIKSLSENLYSHPNSTQLWFCMAVFCLHMDESFIRAASISAQRALCAARDCQSGNEAAKMLATASVAEHLAGNYTCALLKAKQGLHIYPGQVEIWAALMYTLLSTKQYVQRKQWLLNVAIYIRRHLEISRVLSRWVSLIEKRLSKVG